MAATVTITLKDGLQVGDQVLTEAELREITAGDVIEAQEEAEKLVQSADGPRLVASPTLVGLGILRRQIKRIGSVQGPISVSELKKLSARDLNLLDVEAKRLEMATAAALAAEGAGKGDDAGR
jgi:phage FluMu protein gp41